jgi:hypothetical protein
MNTIAEEPDEEEEFCVAECNIYKQRFGLAFHTFHPKLFSLRHKDLANLCSR